MNQEPRLIEVERKWLVGLHLPMSLAQDRTSELWQSFMPRRKEITHSINSDLISLQIYPQPLSWPPDPNVVFEKWAGVEVAHVDPIPKDMDSLYVQAGLYAVFTHIGAATTAQKTFTYILGEWLPRSPFLLDDRPHFEVLGKKYRNDHPESEEEIWIPVKHRVTPDGHSG
jgi:AraC family transcriptional regulator